MHELYELKEKLCDELKEYGGKEMSAGSLEVIDKLAHATKNLDKIIEAYEEQEGGYSSRSYPDGMGGSYRGYSREGYNSYRGSYARGRGSNAQRDSRGRYSSRGYSRDDGMVEELRGLMDDAPNDIIRRDIQRLVEKIEQM